MSTHQRMYLTAAASRAALVGLVALLAGCSLGLGTPYPGVPKRVRFDDNYVRVDRNTGRVLGPASVRSTYGGGAWGGTVGVAIGSGDLHVGDKRAPTVTDAAARVEIVRNFGSSLGLSLGAGVVSGEGSFTFEEGGEPMTLAATSIPIELAVLWTPTFPFLLHAGVAADSYTLTLADGRKTKADDAIVRDGVGMHAFAGLGISFFFGGVAFLVQGEWRWRHLGRHDFGAVSGEVSGNHLLVRMIMVL